MSFSSASNMAVGSSAFGHIRILPSPEIRILHPIASTICCAIDRYMAQGASYLLNVGPDAKGVITEEYERRLMNVADWYNRMEGCLEDHEEDTFGYEVVGDKYIATKKGGKTYLHFYDGIASTAVALKKYPGVPKRVRLMNTNETLAYDVIYLPEDFQNEDGHAQPKRLHIYGIDADSLASEPIVIEIEW